MSFIESHADSVIEILAAQCTDLEVLLALARQETDAAERLDFDRLLQVTRDRAALGERLEVYHRQIAQMRANMQDGFDSVIGSESALRVTTLITEIQTQDAHTRPLLIAAKSEAAEQIGQLDQVRRGVAAYMRDGRGSSIACDQLA